MLHSTPMEMSLNEIGVDASTLGTHEFDQGLDFLTNYLRNLDHKIVLSNLQAKGSPTRLIWLFWL